MPIGRPDRREREAPLDVFKAAIDTYASAIANATDGGTKAIIERKKQRTMLIKNDLLV